MEDENDDRDDTKRRSRNLSEKKRRDQFNSLVNDLSALISTSNRKMDKSTVLKSTITFLKHHNEATDRSKVFEIEQDWKPSFLSNDEFTQLMLESLDGFIIVFGSRGSIFYTSDSITAQLGYLPGDLTRRTIFDLAYEMDHESLLNVFLNHKPVIEPMQTDISSRNQITFFVHLKRGGVDDRSSCNAYELVKFVGYFRNDVNMDTVSGAGGGTQNTQSSLSRILQMPAAKEIDKKLIFVGTGRLQMPQLIREITVTDPTRNEFTSNHSMEWKFLFLDHRAPPIIGYMPFEVLGTSGYDYYHFDDIDDIVTCHEELMQSGKGKSGFYRFLTKGQQWIWLQTDFIVSYNQFNAKPDYVVCTHKVVNYADVLKTQKKSQQNLLSHISPADTLKSPASGIRDLESTSSHLEATAVPPTSKSVLVSNNSGVIGGGNTHIMGDLLSNENSPSMDALWTSTSPPTGAGNSHINTLKSASRPASSYGNISSTGVSPNVKRKRYPYHYRGNESDSTSMSADSGASRHSLMTHMSSSRPRFSSASTQQQSLSSSVNQHQQPHHHQHQQHPMSLPNNQIPQVFNHQAHQQSLNSQLNSHQQFSMQLNSNSVQQADQKLTPMLSQHNSPSITTSNSCQFSQPAFPLRNPQIVAPTFLEPPQYLTAIPVQQVIAPFPVAPVLSPLPNQSDMLAGSVIMTPTQSQLQEQLQRKHDELQKLIMQQQDELRIVSEQLLLARYTLLQPMVPVNYNTTANNTRNYNYNTNTVQTQFNQYGFAMNAGEMQNQHDQQVMMQQQHNLQHQMNQNHAHQQQSAQQLQQAMMQTQANHNDQQHLQPPTEPLNINRPVTDLDQFAQEEFDAFLNLSPLHSMEGSQCNLQSLSSVNNNNNTTNSPQLSNPHIANNQNPTNPSAKSCSTNAQSTTFNNNPQTSEDSLLSYMQMAADASPALNFNMGISDDGSESQNEDAKLLHNPNSQRISSTQPSVAQPQQRSPAFFPAHNFQNLSSANQNPSANNNISNTTTTTEPSNSNTDPLPLDTILPYEINQGQSPNLFNASSSHAPGSSQ